MTTKTWSEVVLAVRKAIAERDFEEAHVLLDPFEDLAAANGRAELAGKVAFYRGICFDTEGLWAEAATAFREAIDFDSEAHGAESRAVADAMSSLALVYTNAKDFVEAATVYIDAADLYKAIGDPVEANGCRLQACQRLLDAGDFEGCLEGLGHVDADATPAQRVYRLMQESEVLRRYGMRQDPEPRSTMMYLAFDQATESTRVVGDSSEEFQRALRGAWMNYAFMCLCFRRPDPAALAYSIALGLATNNAEKRQVQERAKAWSAEGYALVLREFDADAFVVAEQQGEGRHATVTVYHREHGVRTVAGNRAVGKTAAVQVVDGVYRLASDADDT